MKIWQQIFWSRNNEKRYNRWLYYTKKRQGNKREVKAIDAQVKMGSNRALEKVKDIRQKFTNHFINATKTGSGKYNLPITIVTVWKEAK